MSFWDKIFHYDSIFIVAIADQKFKYLTLENYNNVYKKSYLGIIFFSIFGFIMTGCGILMFKDRKLVKIKKIKKVKNKKKEKV